MVADIHQSYLEKRYFILLHRDDTPLPLRGKERETNMGKSIQGTL